MGQDLMTNSICALSIFPLVQRKGGVSLIKIMWGHTALGVSPQAATVNQLLQVSEKCQSTIVQSGPDGILQHDLQANSNM
ncbi:hypothetical protein YC2023_072737 [Brassica napus]